jgi:hypothetical protein
MTAAANTRLNIVLASRFSIMDADIARLRAVE